MARERFILRLLDAEGQLLGWTEVWAEPRPQVTRASCPYWPIGITSIAIERDGTATELTVHWPDLDIARRRSLDVPSAVAVGQVYLWTWFEPVWLVAGMTDVPLPAVTVRTSTAISPPAAGLGVRSMAP